MGGKNQNPKKSLGLPTKPQKIPGPKINLKKSHAEFPSQINFQKGLINNRFYETGACNALNIKKKGKTSLVVLYSQNDVAWIRGHYHESLDCFE